MKRILSTMLLISGVACADGGGLTCGNNDVTIDTSWTTIWRPRVTRVLLNGVDVTKSGIAYHYNGPAHPFADFLQVRLEAINRPYDPWGYLHLHGGGFDFHLTK